MSVLPVLGRLEDVSVRAAFAQEAGHLTPWLAANLDRLSDIIGIQLELIDREVRVESFAADILAEDAQTGRRVLIENQLEASDHTHLGQIMTYLAGLNASVMVWIATGFREPHLAAIRWLNEHTVEPFAFFAARLRLVRIGASELAPLLEVVERPNGWERQVQEVRRERESFSAVGERRLAFWTHMAERHPGLGTSRNGTSFVWLRLPPTELRLALCVNRADVVVFVRGGRGASPTEFEAIVAPHLVRLAEMTGGNPLRDTDYSLIKKLKIDIQEQTNWDRATDWLAEQAQRYLSAFQQEFSGYEETPIEAAQ